MPGMVKTGKYAIQISLDTANLARAPSDYTDTHSTNRKAAIVCLRANRSA